MDESIFYNAIASYALGSYSIIKKMQRRAATWERAYEIICTEDQIPDPKKSWEQMEKYGVGLMLASDKRYPAALKQIPHPPFGIYYRGDITALDRNQINFAIIGTRRATPEGKTLAKKFGHELTNSNFTIISGLAFGIDAAGHQGCLDANGTTVAVFACGLDNIYPHSNAAMADQIIKNGGVFISEYPIGEPPLPYRFLERNRIISGLSRGVLVVEAPDGSGSLATARFALEQDRDVFVTPGTVSHANFKGSHELIRQGATLVTEPDDILEAYGIEKAAGHKKKNIPSSAEESLIMMVLNGSAKPVDVDKIIQLTRLEPRIVNRTITFLLLKDFIKEIEGGYTI